MAASGTSTQFASSMCAWGVCSHRPSFRFRSFARRLRC
jgi:hypothetical protein